MQLLSLKNKIHKSVNTIFYIIILGIGFLIGLFFNKIDFNKLVSQVLMIDSVSAIEIGTINGNKINEEFIFNTFNNHEEGFLSEYPYIVCIYHTTPTLECTAYSEEYFNTLYVKTTDNYKYSIGTTGGNNYKLMFSMNKNGVITGPITHLNNGPGSSSYVDISFWRNGTGYTVYSNFDPKTITGSSSTYKTAWKTLDFTPYQNQVKLDAQVNTWNGYGYDFYTNQVGILDMRKDTYIVNSHTCPNDGEFVTGYDGQTKDICKWSYYNDLSDFLVFYFNGRIYDSENVEWSDITFLQGHTYSLSFTLYGLVPQEQLYSIQFSHEGELTQEIYSSSFGKVLTDSLDSRTYLTFSITPTEDITFDHFFLKYFTNGSYAQTVGASRLWVYNDYTGLSDEAIQIIQTDKLLSQNQALKDLIENPFVNTEEVDSFWNNFKQDDFGLTQIVTLPLNTIKKISNGTCTPLNINILGKTIQLPCGDTLFWNREDIKDFKLFWNMIFGGILCYGIAISIYKDIHKAQSPMNDKLEVIDL